MIDRIDSIITSVENGLFAVLGEETRTPRRGIAVSSRKAVRKTAKKTVKKTVKKKVRKKRK